jgi:hypothetical protein
MEGAMEGPYTIDKRQHKWVVSANGTALLKCARKTTAEHVAQKANDLLWTEHRLDEEEAKLPRFEVS